MFVSTVRLSHTSIILPDHLLCRNADSPFSSWLCWGASLTWISALIMVLGVVPDNPAIDVICFDASNESLSMSLSASLVLPMAASRVSVRRAGLRPRLIISAASRSISALISGF